MFDSGAEFCVRPEERRAPRAVWHALGLCQTHRKLAPGEIPVHRLAPIALFAIASHAAFASSPAEERCVLLNAVTIPLDAISLPTSGARVTSAEFVPATGNGAALVAEHCQIVATIRPRDPAAP